MCSEFDAANPKYDAPEVTRRRPAPLVNSLPDTTPFPGVVKLATTRERQSAGGLFTTHWRAFSATGAPTTLYQPYTRRSTEVRSPNARYATRSKNRLDGVFFERARRAVLPRVATRAAPQVITDTAELDFRSSTEVRSPNARDAPRSNYRLDVDRARAYSRRVAARAAGQTITDGVEFDHHSAGYRLSTGKQGLPAAVVARARALSTVASTGTLSHLFRHTSEFCVSVEDFSSSTALGRPDFQSQCRLRRHCD